MSGLDAQVGRPPLIPSDGAPPDESAEAPDPGRRVVQRYGTIIIVGGGCYGSYYLRQLGRAATAGAITWDQLVLVDRDAACRVTSEFGELTERWPTTVSRPRIIVGDWHRYFADYLGSASEEHTTPSTDAIVPSPLMPHLMYDWLLDRARARWPGRAVRRKALEVTPPVPWTRAGEDGTQYVSFAEWMCPINCIEPARCPHTRGPRSWSLPPTLRDFVETQRAGGRRLQGPCIFHCTHRAYGVGMLDTRDVLAADRFVTDVGAAGEVEVLVGTASHCHGALGILSIGPNTR